MKKAGFVVFGIILGCFAISCAAGEDTPASQEEQIAALEERLESAGIVSIEPFLGTWEGKRVDGTTMTLSMTAYDEVNGKVSINLFDVDGDLYAFSQGVGQALALRQLVVLVAEANYSMVLVLRLNEDDTLVNTGMVEWDAGSLAYAHDPGGKVVFHRIGVAD
jgi:hypothetical protein